MLKYGMVILYNFLIEFTEQLLYCDIVGLFWLPFVTGHSDARLGQSLICMNAKMTMTPLER